MSQRERKQLNREWEAPAERENDGSELPEGWAWAAIADVTESVPNIKPQEEPNREFASYAPTQTSELTFRFHNPRGAPLRIVGFAQC